MEPVVLLIAAANAAGRVDVLSSSDLTFAKTKTGPMVLQPEAGEPAGDCGGTRDRAPAIGFHPRRIFSKVTRQDAEAESTCPPRRSMRGDAGQNRIQ